MAARWKNSLMRWTDEGLIAPSAAERIHDPSIRTATKELWGEVTIPKKGPPRPIRLGVKKGDGPITPLELR